MTVPPSCPNVLAYNIKIKILKTKQDILPKPEETVFSKTFKIVQNPTDIGKFNVTC